MTHTHTPPRGRLQAIFDDSRKQPTDASQYWTDSPASIDWQACYNERAAHTAELTATIAALRSDLSGARFERDIWWPLAFAVGLTCGAGLSWWLI